MTEDAARGLGQARRISVVGPTGSGKSYLARELSKRSGLPLYELDRLRWDASGTELPRDEFIEAVRALAGKDAWIIDGHYRDVRHLVWRRAETVVWLNYPLAVIASRLIRRFVKKRASNRFANGASGSTRQPEPSAVVASWRERLGRLARTLHERGEYGRLLGAPEYRAVSIVELRSVAATREWMRDDSTRAAARN